MECKDLQRDRKAIWMVVVLIETLWNVKFLLLFWLLLPECRINRNIVECKEITGYPIPEHNRINRNIVECKGKRSTDVFLSPACINRNIVECKEQL